ncbi:MAG: flagellar hook-basal body complex protein, partial [Alphaproteobacteria bacterium]
MENPSFIAISHLAGLRRQLDVIANNVANAATAGYQGERMSFETMVSRKARSPGVGGAGQAASFVVDKGLWRDYRPGPVERTGNTFDVALIGPGYIAVQTEEGERYTRAGAFRTDAQGRLALGNGALLLSDGGQPITVPPGETQFEIDRRGVITGKDGVVGRIRVVRFDDEQALVRLDMSEF